MQYLQHEDKHIKHDFLPCLASIYCHSDKNARSAIASQLYHLSQSEVTIERDELSTTGSAQRDVHSVPALVGFKHAAVGWRCVNQEHRHVWNVSFLYILEGMQTLTFLREKGHQSLAPLVQIQICLWNREETKSKPKLLLLHVSSQKHERVF